MAGTLETTFKIGAILSSSLSQAFNASNSQISGLQGKVKALSSVAGNIKAYQKLQSSITKNQAAMHNFQSKALALRSSLAGDLTGSAERSFNRLVGHANTAQEAIERNRAEMEKLRPALTAAGVDLNNLGSEYHKFASQANTLKLNNLKEQLSWGNVVNGFMNAAQPIMMFKGPIQEAAGFEQQMARVKAVVTIAGKSFAELQAQARDLGRKTQFSAVQAAQSQENLARAGFNSNEIFDAMPGLLNMAAAEGMDLGTAANIAASALRSFGLDASQMGKVADILAATSSAAKTDIVELGEGLKYVGATAHSLKIPLGSTTTLLGALANSGLESSMAGTSLNAMFNRLTDPRIRKKLEETYKVAVETKAGGIVRPEVIMANLDKALKGKSDVERSGILKQLFGDAGRAANIIMDSMRQLQTDDDGNVIKFVDEKGVERAMTKFEYLAQKIKDCDGESERMAKTMNATAQGALTTLSSATSNLSIAIGNVFLPTVASVANMLAKAAGAVSEFAEAHPALTKAILGTVAGFGAFRVAVFGGSTALKLMEFPFVQITEWGNKLKDIGGMAGVFGKLSTGVTSFAGKAAGAIGGFASSIGTAFKAIGTFMLTNPFGLILTGIVAVGAAVYGLWKNWGKIDGYLSKFAAWRKLKDVAGKAWDGIKSAAGKAWDSIKEAWQNPSVLWDKAVAGWEQTKSMLATGWDAVKNGAAKFGSWLADKGGVIWDGLKTGWNAASQWLSDSWETVKSYATDFGAWLSSTGETIWAGLKSTWDTTCSALSTGWDAVKGYANDFSGWLNSTGEVIWDGVVKGWQTRRELLEKGWETVKSYATDFGSWLSSTGESIWAGLKSTWDTTCSALSTGWDTVKGYANDFSGWLNSTGEVIWDGVVKGWQTRRELLEKGWETVKSYATDFGSWLSSTGETIWNSVVESWQTRRELLEKGWEAVKGFATGFSSWLADNKEAIWNGVIEGWNSVSTLLENGWNAVKGFVDGFKNWLSEFGGSIWDGLKAGWDTCSEYISMGISKIGEAWDKGTNWLSSSIGGLWDSMWGNGNPADEIIDKTSLAKQLDDITVLNKMSSTFAGRVQEMTDAWHPFKDSLATGFEKIFSIMGETVAKISNEFVPAIVTLTGKLAEMASSVQSIAQAANGGKPTGQKPVAMSNYLFGGAHATGGIFDRPHVGLVAEAGPEAIIPLSDRSRGIPLLEQAASALGVGTSSTESTTNNSYAFNFTINSTGGDGESIAAIVGEKVESILNARADMIARTNFSPA